MKTLAVLFLISLTIGLSGCGQGEILIQSEQSKTTQGDPVFNRIRLIQEKGRDIWMMNQSHHGLQASPEQWDRLAIVVDKTGAVKTARFYQIAPGKLEWQENLPQQNFPISCFMCHSNGPRVIRPEPVASAVNLSIPQKAQLMWWNFKIKTYGRIVASDFHDQQDPMLAMPFRHRSAYENETLKIATCVHCHQEKGFFARGALTRQNLMSVRFMTEKGYMPPPGFWLSKSEKQQLKKFVAGF